MKRAKALVAVGVFLFLLPSFPARADLTMTVLRESYHAWGSVSQYDFDENPEGPPILLSDQYDVSLSRTYPADRWTASIEVSGRADVGFDQFHSTAGSSAGREGSQFRVSHDWFPNGVLGGPGNANAHLQADLLFGGSDESLNVFSSFFIGRPPLDGEFRGDATLTDLVTGTLREITSSDPFAYVVPLTKTHIYRLEMFLEGSPFKSENEISVAFTNVSQVGPEVVPLPGAVWLGILGLSCAGRWLRCRRQGQDIRRI